MLVNLFDHILRELERRAANQLIAYAFKSRQGAPDPILKRIVIWLPRLSVRPANKARKCTACRHGIRLYWILSQYMNLVSALDEPAGQAEFGGKYSTTIP
jgi:hypothetical protein